MRPVVCRLALVLLKAQAALQKTRIHTCVSALLSESWLFELYPQVVDPDLQIPISNVPRYAVGPLKLLLKPGRCA